VLVQVGGCLARIPLELHVFTFLVPYPGSTPSPVVCGYATRRRR
jgi:hypothetical protein